MKKKQKILTLLCIIYSVAFHTLILNLTLLPDNDSTNDTMTYELIKGSLIITEEYSEFSEGILENLTLYESGYLSLNSSLQAAWNELGGIPSARGRPAMAYDSAHDRMVLFGGAVSSGIYSDETWVYNLNDNTWLNATDENPKPSARWGHSMVYDSTHDRTVLFGGEDDIGHSNETWIFNLNDNTWTNITPSVGPAGRMMHAMAYDSTRERVVLFGGDPPGTGGFYSDTWILNLTDNSWTEVSPNPNPGEYFGHSLVYDSAHDRMVLFGDDDTWIYNFTDNTWTKVDSGSGPNLKHHSMAYDAVHEVSIMFGGYNSGYFDNTWTYNLTDNSWTEVDSGSGPSGRYGHSMAYDSAHGVMVMFGGNNDGNYLGDMWKFSMSNYHKRGQFISKIISFDSIYKIQGNLSWNPLTQLHGTSLVMQVGISNTTEDLDFVYSTLHSDTFAFEGTGKYLKYRGVFSSNQERDLTPLLRHVNISYSLKPVEINPPDFPPIPGFDILILISSMIGVSIILLKKYKPKN